MLWLDYPVLQEQGAEEHMLESDGIYHLLLLPLSWSGF